VTTLRERVEAWIAADPDERDRTTLQRLLDEGNDVELHRRFDYPLTFGTAGLRGEEMAGPAGMNRLTVRRATQGVVAWLQSCGLDPNLGVVVGRDARRGSEAFNDEVVAVLLGAGVRVFEMPRPLPTPLVAFAVRSLGAVAGIMITASHNPPADNGYKLYGPDGTQIVSPTDAVVEAAMATAGAPTLGERGCPHHHVITEGQLQPYVDHMVARFAVPANDFPIVYTPLHGVGGEFFTRLFAEAGYGCVTTVAEQFAPDGDFPTVAFPNPEEPGALDRAFRLARDVDAALIIANDPDADRLSIAARAADGAWRALRGDEVGWLLGAEAIATATATDVVATTIVSSSLLGTMAAAAGVTYRETLTGFKWVSKAAGDGRLTFGYEEALGYGVDPLVGDKDGLSAALAFAKLAYQLARRGQTVFDRLDELETTFGVHAGTQVSLRVSPPAGREVLAATMARVRTSPPLTLGGRAVTEVIDLEAGWRGLAPTEGLIWGLEHGGRVVVRPSGTEPKLKAYVEVVMPRDGSLHESRRRGQFLLDAIREDVVGLLAL
jgi:phosphomannomutase